MHAISPAKSIPASLTRPHRRRGAVATLLAFGLVAGACSNGADEGGAYAAQLIALIMLGAADTPLYNGVRRARDAVLAGHQRAARVATIAMR